MGDAYEGYTSRPLVSQLVEGSSRTYPISPTPLLLVTALHRLLCRHAVMSETVASGSGEEARIDIRVSTARGARGCTYDSDLIAVQGKLYPRKESLAVCVRVARHTRPMDECSVHQI